MTAVRLATIAALMFLLELLVFVFAIGMVMR